MATLNAAQTLEQATDFAADFATATLLIKAGATTLASHSTTSWTPSNSGNDGLATATFANGGVENISATGTADGATLTAGTKVITLTVGVGSGDLSLDTTNYQQNESSTVNSLVVTFPAA